MTCKVLNCASQGGHWIQLRRLDPAFVGTEVYYLSTTKDYVSQCPDGRYLAVPDANIDQKFRLLIQAIFVGWRLLVLRPDVIVSTGASVGFFALLIGKLLGARTVWVDSIANVEQCSSAGRHVARYADLYLTQWPHLAKENGPSFLGKVL